MSSLQRVPFEHHQKLQAQISARVLRDHGEIMLNQTALWVTWLDGDRLESWPEDKRTQLFARLIGCPPIPAGYRRLYSYYTCYYGEGAHFLEYVDIPAYLIKDNAFEDSLGEGSALR